MARMPQIGGNPQSFGETEVAETFAESDVTLTHSQTEVSGQSLQLIPHEAGSTAAFSASSGSYSNRSTLGIEINPNNDLEAVEVSSLNGSNIDGVRLEDSGANTLADESYSGGALTLNPSGTLLSGTTYRIVAYNDSGSLGGSYANDGSATSTDVDIVGGIGPNGFYFIFENVQARLPVASGTAHVEWPYPPDVSSWDRAFFAIIEDNETADVYVEEAQGSPGWTEIAGPIQAGDKIPADPSNNVRFRIDFSRTNTANNPQVANIYRRRVWPGGDGEA